MPIAQINTEVELSIPQHGRTVNDLLPTSPIHLQTTHPPVTAAAIEYIDRKRNKSAKSTNRSPTAERMQIAKDVEVPSQMYSETTPPSKEQRSPLTIQPKSRGSSPSMIPIRSKSATRRLDSNIKPLLTEPLSPSLDPISFIAELDQPLSFRIAVEGARLAALVQEVEDVGDEQDHKLLQDILQKLNPRRSSWIDKETYSSNVLSPKHIEDIPVELSHGRARLQELESICAEQGKIITLLESELSQTTPAPGLFADIQILEDEAKALRSDLELRNAEYALIVDKNLQEQSEIVTLKDALRDKQAELELKLSSQFKEQQSNKESQDEAQVVIKQLRNENNALQSTKISTEAEYSTMKKRMKDLENIDRECSSLREQISSLLREKGIYTSNIAAAGFSALGGVDQPISRSQHDEQSNPQDGVEGAISRHHPSEELFLDSLGLEKQSHAGRSEVMSELQRADDVSATSLGDHNRSDNVFTKDHLNTQETNIIDAADMLLSINRIPEEWPHTDETVKIERDCQHPEEGSIDTKAIDKSECASRIIDSPSDSKVDGDHASTLSHQPPVTDTFTYEDGVIRHNTVELSESDSLPFPMDAGLALANAIRLLPAVEMSDIVVKDIEEKTSCEQQEPSVEASSNCMRHDAEGMPLEEATQESEVMAPVKTAQPVAEDITEYKTRIHQLEKLLRRSKRETDYHVATAQQYVSALQLARTEVLAAKTSILNMAEELRLLKIDATET